MRYLRCLFPLAFLLTACGTSGPAGDADAGATQVDAGVERGTCETPPQARGILANDVADIDFSGEEVQATVEHKLDIDVDEDGCVVGLTLTMRKAGLGCEFQLAFRSREGQPMALESARLSADSFCPGWSDSDEGSYELAAGEAQLIFVSRVPDRTSRTSCIGSTRASFSGTIELRDGSRSVSVDLSQLSIEGDFLSQGNTDATCPCVPACEGECGTDPVCGTSCGGCGADQLCSADNQCICAPDCAGRSCGSDGCGGTCAPGCTDGSSCDEASGQCSCIGSCEGRECGDDGCGGSCGSCTGADECTAGGMCAFTCVERVWEGNASITNATELNALNGYTQVRGDLTIGGRYQSSSLRSLSGLDCLQRVDGMLQIADNAGLTSLDGLESLRSVTDLQIWGNANLERIDGLRSLSTLTTLSLGTNDSLRELDGLGSIGALSRLTIQNSALTTLDGLEGLRTIRSSLLLRQNGVLAEIEALAGVTEISSIMVRENPRLGSVRGLRSVNSSLSTLTLQENSALRSLEGLESIGGEDVNLVIEENENLSDISSLAGLQGLAGVRIARNTRLASLDGLQGVTRVEGSVNLSSNRALATLSGLRRLTTIGGGMSITSNSSLTDIEALNSLTSLGANLSLTNNRMLSTCDAESLRDLLVSRGWTQSATISGNASCP